MEKEKKSIKLGFRITETEARSLLKEAKTQERTVSFIIIKAIQAYLGNNS